MRVLFDTNVLYSALVAKGFCEDAVADAAGRCTIVWSQPLRDELMAVLRRKFKLGPGTLAALDAFAALCEWVVPASLSQPVCRDPDDDLVLGTALAAHADVIVTGDDDLLVLKAFGGSRILSPRHFLEMPPP